MDYKQLLQYACKEGNLDVVKFIVEKNIENICEEAMKYSGENKEISAYLDNMKNKKNEMYVICFHYRKESVVFGPFASYKEAETCSVEGKYNTDKRYKIHKLSFDEHIEFYPTKYEEY